MTVDQQKDLALCINEVKSMAAELEEASKRGELTVGLVVSFKDIITRFTIPRLEAITE